MQCTDLNTRDYRGKEKSVGICKKSFSRESDGLVFRQLLAAVKDMEREIGCIFELNSIKAAPLDQIWDRLAVAIEAAQQSLQSQH